MPSLHVHQPRRIRCKDEAKGASRHQGYARRHRRRFFHADPAKSLVMTCIDQLVADGYADWDMLDNGDIQLRFKTGELFVLTETMIIRIA